MSYGIKAVNKDGVSLIDENSKQVHISKAGSVLPGTLGVTDSTNNSANTGPQARAVVVPGEVGETLVFVRPRATSGNQTAATFSVHMGLVGKGWTSTAATVVGQSYILATPTGQLSVRPSITLSVSAGDVISGATSGVSGTVIRSMTGNSSTYIRLRNASGTAEDFTIGESLLKNGSSTGATVPQGTIGNPGSFGEGMDLENFTSDYCPYEPYPFSEDENYLVDTIGGLTGAQSNWASGNSNSLPRIIDIETTSTTGVYKLYLDGTWSSSLAAGTPSRGILRNVAIFAREFQSSFPSNHVLDYRFGVLDNEADESAGYGFELRDANGNLTYSSNRVNFQIESITTGNADVVGNRDISGGNPFFDYEVNDPTNYQDYFALVASFGPSALCLEGSATSNTRGYWLYSTGFSFSPPGYRPYDNATAGYGLLISPSDEKSSRNAGGIAHCAVAFARWVSGPQLTGGAYVNETLNHLSPRDLIIGKFI
jgi:hypothetical protein